MIWLGLYQTYLIRDGLYCQVYPSFYPCMHYCVQLQFHRKLTSVSQGYANSLSQTGEGVGYSVVHFLLVEVLGRVRIGADMGYPRAVR